MIVYLRVVPGFGVAVEEAQRPELRSCPLVIGGLPHQRGIVREANQLAQRSGVRPGMTLSQAHQQCPHGVFLIPDGSRYELVWEEVCAILRRHTPLVEPVEMGQAVCDMSGDERFRRDESSAGRNIALQIERSTGIRPALGIASNRLVAQLASMFPEPDGVAVIDRGRERAFLADLPLTLLPGVDPRLALTFQVLGLTTISQFAALPSSAAKQRFGTTGEQLHRYARGIDPCPVLSPPEKSSVVARYECEDGSIEEAMDSLRRLADTCAGELQGRGASGKLVGLTLIWAEESIRLPPLPKRAEIDQSDEPVMLLPPKAQMPALPIPYRVHSARLPQPGGDTPSPGRSPAAQKRGKSADGLASMETTAWQCASVVEQERGNQREPLAHTGTATRQCASVVGRGGGIVAGGDRGGGVPLAASGGQRLETIGRSQEVVAMVRTPIATAPPLLERAQRLLLQSWPQSQAHSGEGDRAPRLLAIELKIGEFTKPSQLSLSNFDRLDQGGMLGGLSTERRQALVRHDEAFEARYGTTAFQHVAAVDSGNILTERRFRWENGLPWNGGEAKRKRS